MFHSKKLINKKGKKIVENRCCLCGNDNYELLDLHRIIPGEKGGRYTDANTITTCSNCHRMIHAEQIIIDRLYSSTGGRVLHYFKDGEEFWKKITII